MGFASRRWGAGALRGRAVLGRGAPLEMVRMGLVRRVEQPRRPRTGDRVKNCGELADGAQLVLAKRDKGCGGQRIGQSVDQVAGSALGVVGRGRLGHGALVGKN